jgi:putative transposase
MDWASRKFLAWRLSNTMDADFCVAALEEAIARGVHQLRLHRRAEEHRHPHLDGWQGPLDGQRIHREAVAIAQRRMCLSQCLRDRKRPPLSFPFA